jgi:hypothetical protein
MADLIPIKYAAVAAIVFQCGHVRTITPSAVHYYRFLMADGIETFCMDCPANDDRRLIIDVITR